MIIELNIRFHTTLGSSCMKNMSKETFNIYVENPDSVKLLILTLDGKLLGRALVWKIDSIKSTNERNITWYIISVYIFH